ncbi:hypothetical protein DSO57_1031789 [Entomophthora muscae]|uniref:Uncharacterized protein n=1 Tax=Entomophthora muscae TaxID=34485 RepID=A0ACC2SDB5_9FUNG|nr:hypothetical protein DSO57_1031789 [Entomophthora muscae]
MSDSSAQTEYEKYYNNLDEEGKQRWRKYPCEYCKYLIAQVWAPYLFTEYFVTDTEASSIIQSNNVQPTGLEVSVTDPPPLLRPAVRNIPDNTGVQEVFLCTLQYNKQDKKGSSSPLLGKLLQKAEALEQELKIIFLIWTGFIPRLQAARRAWRLARARQPASPRQPSPASQPASPHTTRQMGKLPKGES